MIKLLIISVSYLGLINFIFRFLPSLKHNPNKIEHKKINNKDLFQTGGFYLLPLIILVFFEKRYELSFEFYDLILILLFFFYYWINF